MPLKKTNYLDRFKRLSDFPGFEIMGDTIVVEQLAEDEIKTSSGLVIATPDNHKTKNMSEKKSLFVRVLAVGKGYYDEDNDVDVPLDTRPGDICMVGQTSVLYFSVFGDLQDYEPEKIGITKENQIQMRFRGEGVYDAVFEALNRAR